MHNVHYPSFEFDSSITWQTVYIALMVLPLAFTAMKVRILGHHKAFYYTTYCTAVGGVVPAV